MVVTIHYNETGRREAPVKEKVAHLIERFPDHEAIIKALSQDDTRFQDLLSDHYDLHQQLSRASEDDPNLKARYRNLEEELIRLMQGYPMA
jgi:uncharacterized protein YdcH (DUF465 family)